MTAKEAIGKLNKIKKYTAKIALAVGMLSLIVWGTLGTGTTLAWFSDESEEVVNVFNFATFDLELEYRNDEMTEYAPVVVDTNIFGDEALYEPGYTQLVYLKVRNASTIEMNYRLSIDARSVTTAKNVFGGDIYLPNYLRYGVLYSDAEPDMTREEAIERAQEEMQSLTLNAYSEWDSVTLAPGQERYVTLVVYMPREVNNFANYRGSTQPSVELGITVYAQQKVN